MGECKNCKGRGYLYEEVPYYSGVLGPEVTCPTCGGTGKDKVCHLCKGKGYVYQAVPYYSGALGTRVTCPVCNGKGYTD